MSLPSEEVPRFSMEESPPSRHAFFADQSETPSGSAMRRFQQEIKRLHSDLPGNLCFQPLVLVFSCWVSCRKEVTILRIHDLMACHGLPADGIWVRCYSSAVHLMRFIIEGPVDTPSVCCSALQALSFPFSDAHQHLRVCVYMNEC